LAEDQPPDPGPRASRPSQAAAAATRPLLDAIVQSSTVELLHTRGVAVAPLPSSVTHPHAPSFFSLAGVVTFTAPKANGSLSLSWSDPVFSLFTPPVVGPHDSRDILRELTNQLIGRVKNRLMQFQLCLRVGVPSVVSGQVLERQRARPEAEVVYVFRTLRGEVVVIVNAVIDPGALKYSSSIHVAKEGEFIPF
jgi:hypothetical protein